VDAPGTTAMNQRLSPEHQAVVERFEQMNGAAFDRAYLGEMVTHHQKDIAEFERQAESSAGQEQLRALAQKTLPALRQHLEMSQSLLKQLAASR
jgi:putative membrane protein